MKKQKLTVVEMIPFRDFKEKISLTKKHSKHKVRIVDNFVYVQKWRWI